MKVSNGQLNKLYQLKDQSKILQALQSQAANRSAYQQLYEFNKDRLDQIAIYYYERHITYFELFKLIDKAASAFMKLGIKPGNYVGMSMLCTPEGIISFYAFNKIGAIPHMLNVATSKNDIVMHLKDDNAKFYILNDLLYSPKMQEALKEAGVEKVILSSLLDSLAIGLNYDSSRSLFITGAKKIANHIQYDKDHMKWKDFMKLGSYNDYIESYYQYDMPAAICNTSGSTGIPKGVVGTNEAMNHMAMQMGKTDQTFAPGDIMFNTLPLWIWYSLENNIHNPLSLGVGVALDPVYDPKNLPRRMMQYGFHHWNTIPAYVESMVENEKMKTLDLSHMKTITTGGANFEVPLQKKANEMLEQCRAQIKVGQGYGTSEVLGSFSYTFEKDATIGSSGKPLVGNRMKIVDPNTMEILGPNQSGELYLSGPSLMKEYFLNPEETAKALIRDEDGTLWFKTGDYAFISEKGELFFDERICRMAMTMDDQNLPAKIVPEHIKSHLLKHPLIKKCEVITVPDDKRINVPIAFVVLHQDDLDIDQKLQQFCIDHLVSYDIPADIIYLDHIPQMTQKTDFNALHQMYEEKVKGHKHLQLTR